MINIQTKLSDMPLRFSKSIYENYTGLNYYNLSQCTINRLIKIGYVKMCRIKINKLKNYIFYASIFTKNYGLWGFILETQKLCYVHIDLLEEYKKIEEE